MDLVLQTWFTSVTFTYMSNLPEVKITDEREKLRSWLQNLAAAVQFSSQVLTPKRLKVMPNFNSDSTVSHPFPSVPMLSKIAVGHQKATLRKFCQSDFPLPNISPQAAGRVTRSLLVAAATTAEKSTPPLVGVQEVEKATQTSSTRTTTAA